MQEAHAKPAPLEAGWTWSTPETDPRVVVLIPAYQPGPALIGVVRRFAVEGPEAIVVVDDGSGPEYESIFEDIGGLPQVRVIRHAANLGKGAALKTGVGFILRAYPGV